MKFVVLALLVSSSAWATEDVEARKCLKALVSLPINEFPVDQPFKIYSPYRVRGEIGLHIAVDYENGCDRIYRCEPEADYAMTLIDDLCGNIFP